jgi:hypothetical protein
MGTESVGGNQCWGGFGEATGYRRCADKLLRENPILDSIRNVRRHSESEPIRQLPLPPSSRSSMPRIGRLDFCSEVRGRLGERRVPKEADHLSGMGERIASRRQCLEMPASRRGLLDSSIFVATFVKRETTPCKSLEVSSWR